MLVSFNGLVVREEKSGDYGKFITVLTDNCGRVQMSAKGVGSVKNRNAAACSIFTYGEFVAYYRDGRYTLKSSSPERYCIRHDGKLEQLALASYIAELADIFGRGENDTSEIMHYCINALHILYKDDRPRRMIKAVYELRMLCAAGYMPNLEECAVCGGELCDEEMYFCFVDGVFVCKCCTTEPYVKKRLVSLSCFNLMKYVISSPENKAYAVKVPEKTEKEFCSVCCDFLLAQLEKKPDTLDFYNTVEDSNGKF
ncbi:MAG: DNA repair protein RecO [Ruminococcaceae bacterium]|nr:DNA repair protein RecO [Oscillospiraceae bacterium]